MKRQYPHTVSFYRAPQDIDGTGTEYRAEPTPAGSVFAIRRGHYSDGRGWQIGTRATGQFVSLGILARYDTLKESKAAVRVMARHPQRVAIAEAIAAIRAANDGRSQNRAANVQARIDAIVSMWRDGTAFQILNREGDTMRTDEPRESLDAAEHRIFGTHVNPCHSVPPRHVPHTASDGQTYCTRCGEKIAETGAVDLTISNPSEVASRVAFEREHPETRDRREERARVYGRTPNDVAIENEHNASVCIEELELGVRAYNILKRMGVDTCGDLTNLAVEDLNEWTNSTGIGVGLPAFRQMVDAVESLNAS